ncbi:MAG: GH3 family domain-containing protein [Pseudobdellovibrionaceae bacterium]
MIARWCHELIYIYYSRSLKKFRKNLNQIEKVQSDLLRKILTNLKDTAVWSDIDRNLSYEMLREKIPVRSYEDYRDLIDRQKKNGEPLLATDVQRYEPTSGSTECRKWIPYSKSFLTELNNAAAIWLGDTYQSHPKIKQGVHYWSLSWLPEELRSQTSSNDADLFPIYQRWILQNTMAVPPTISHLINPDAAWWASLVYLASRSDLALVSVWSPTFWLKVVKDIKQNWSEISKALQTSSWGLYDEQIQSLLGGPPQRDTKNLRSEDPQFFEKLWPSLALISAWDSSSSREWSDRIKEIFPAVAFQGKGLWATEGVLSIPFQEKKILSIQSHFYEFKDLETGIIVPSWEVKKGREYQPILWTSSGLLRYQLQDRVQVSGFIGQTPCLEFLGRLHSIDLVGEKMDANWVQTLFQKNSHWGALCLVACRKPEPHYVLVHEKTIAIDVEEELLKLHHYKVAREIGQLSKASCLVVADVFEFLSKIQRSKVVGQNKIEVLLEMESL